MQTNILKMYLEFKDILSMTFLRIRSFSIWKTQSPIAFFAVVGSKVSLTNYKHPIRVRDLSTWGKRNLLSLTGIARFSILSMLLGNIRSVLSSLGERSANRYLLQPSGLH